MGEVTRIRGPDGDERYLDMVLDVLEHTDADEQRWRRSDVRDIGWHLSSLWSSSSRVWIETSIRISVRILGKRIERREAAVAAGTAVLLGLAVLNTGSCDSQV
jgi:hypothetical protein